MVGRSRSTSPIRARPVQVAVGAGPVARAVVAAVADPAVVGEAVGSVAVIGARTASPPRRSPSAGKTAMRGPISTAPS